MSYEVLKNRMQNGQPFLRETALTRINALADALEISQEQADELTAIAQANGLDILPDDYQARIDALDDSALLHGAQIQALSDRGEFIEDCIAEMAMMVYQ